MPPLNYKHYKYLQNQSLYEIMSEDLEEFSECSRW